MTLTPVATGAEFNAQHPRDAATGKFVTSTNASAGSGVITGSEGWAERVEALKADGYVPAQAIAGVPDQPDQWWRGSWAVAEYGHEDGEYPQMPDDQTPAMTGGRSLHGNRRTHRRTYSGSGVELRMPSAAAIKRHAGPGPTTFDVPITYNDAGGEVTGWVRVTKHGNAWGAQGLGEMDEATRIRMGESVQAVLEARHPTRGLAGAGDLLDRHRQRMIDEGVKPDRISSSAFRSMGYEPAGRTMVATFNRGATYAYSVSPEVFAAVKNSASPGAAYNELVKHRAPRVGVSACGSCGRYTSDLGRHRCPPVGVKRQADSRNVEQRQAVIGKPVTVKAQPKVAVAEWLQRDAQQAVREQRFQAGPSIHGPGVQRGFTSATDVCMPIERHATGVQDGTIRFAGLGGEDAGQLVRGLPSRVKAHRPVGHGPTTETMLSVAARHPHITLSGHVVGPSTPRETVALTGVRVAGASSAADAKWKARLAGLTAVKEPRQVTADGDGWVLTW